LAVAFVGGQKDKPGEVLEDLSFEGGSTVP
jgi:hypothetical protein